MSFLRNSSLIGVAGSLMLVGCATPAVVKVEPATTATGASQVASYSLQGTATNPASESFTIKANAPITPFEAVAGLPEGETLQLGFKAAKSNGKAGRFQIVYAEGLAFDLTFVSATSFEVIDGDATDGKATVQVPSGSYDVYTKANGGKNGSVAASDPLYFQAGSLASTGDRGWAHVGVRSLPFSYSKVLGEYRLSFQASGVTGFNAALVTSGAAAQVPPLPPSILSLTGPDSVKAGKTADVVAAIEARAADALTYTWSTTDPAGVTTLGNPVGDTNAVFTAPSVTGQYQIGLRVENAYFSTQAAQPLSMTVQPNLVLRASVGYGQWGWDIANCNVAGLDMSPILCSDGQLHVPNGFRADLVGGFPYYIHAAYPNWFDATLGNGNFQWWTYGGYGRYFKNRTVSVRATYNQGNVTGQGPIQGTTTFTN